MPMDFQVAEDQTIAFMELALERGSPITETEFEEWVDTNCEPSMNPDGTPGDALLDLPAD